jgi:LAS superfamily LD-carboxypeptidase LdcB
MMRKVVKREWMALAGIAAGVFAAVWLNATKPQHDAVVVHTPTHSEAVLQALHPDDPTIGWGNENCGEARFEHAAFINASNLHSLSFAPFHRPERGWETYAPLIATEIGTRCAPNSPGFASALAQWQQKRGLNATGQLDQSTFAFMKAVWQDERPFVLTSRSGCPAPPSEADLETSRPGEGYGGKVVQLTPGAFAAYRRMVRDARAQVPAIRADPRYLQIFSAFRSPAYDAARCEAEHNCNGIVRATCSAHRTGRAMDLYVGSAPGFGPDSTADPNRLAMTQSPAYRWLVLNARNYGFVPYAFEPWHWEWIGDPSSSNQS